MIGSVTQAWQEMADLARRREAIAAQGAAATAPPAAASPPAAGHAPVVLPAAGYGPVHSVAKSAEPDVGKRKSGAGNRRPAKDAKRGKPDLLDGEPERGELIGHDLGDEQADTAAHDVAEGAADADRADRARKGYRDRGAQEGPADPEQAGSVEPDDIDRPYLDAGHAAASPGYQPPRSNPVPQPFGRGVPVPIEMPRAPAVAGNAGPLTAAMAAHQARVTLRPPIPGGTDR